MNRRAETEIHTLSHRMNLLLDKLEDVEGVVRQSANPAAETEPRTARPDF